MVYPPILLSIHYQSNLVHNWVSNTQTIRLEDLEICLINKTLFG